MVRRMKRLLMLAAMCSLAAIFVEDRKAEAGAITIKGGYKPGGGDPPYDYIFDVYLNGPTSAGTNTFASGEFVHHLRSPRG